MPPVWEGLEADGKAEDREHGAGDCSDDRDIEAWGGRNSEGKETRIAERSVGETGSLIFSP